MRPHPKAKGNPYQRKLMISRVERGWSVAEASARVPLAPPSPSTTAPSSTGMDSYFSSLCAAMWTGSHAPEKGGAYARSR